MHIHLEEIDSTNNYAKLHYLEFPEKGITSIQADFQTKARGRFDRKWLSPAHLNLYITYCFRLPNPFPPLPFLAQLASISLGACLIEEGVVPTFKWPNDLLIHQKKVAGILCETIHEPTFIQAILGVGLNLNMGQEMLNQIDQPATSLKVETLREFDVKKVGQKIKNRLALDLAIFNI